jgi:hypothetical protein
VETLRHPRVWLVLLLSLATVACAQLARAPRAAADPTWTPQCGDPYPSARDPHNPLMLSPAPPASDPLRGASFFVDGPRHGSAAGAIAQLLGIDTGTVLGSALPSFVDAESWDVFSRLIALHLPLVSPAVAYQVRMLEKIAAQPEAQRISLYSQGGTPVGIYSQTQKLFCHNFTADPGAIPIISTYFLHPKLGGCPSVAQMNAYWPQFKSLIDAMALGVGRRPAVFLLELDATGSSSCIARTHGLRTWEAMLRYEAQAMSALPHTVVYIEGGYSDSNNARYAARLLNAAGVRHVQGFFTNDTHEQWAINEIRYAQKVSRMTGGAHFIVNTAQNGTGPLLNPHPSTQGIENLCNPPGRGLGHRDDTNTGISRLDGLLWTHTPGNSSGCGGGPPGGVFWPARAVDLASRANDRLGPKFPSQPY